MPYAIHTVLTDNGIQFADNHPVDEEAEAKAAYWVIQDRPRIYRWHSFDWACEQTKIRHRLTKPHCSLTNGQVERMNRSIKDATVKRYHCASHDELRQHWQLFVDAYNYGRQLKTLRGLTPYEFICQTWTKEPERFKLDPSHHMLGSYSRGSPRARHPTRGDKVARGQARLRANAAPMGGGALLCLGHFEKWQTDPWVADVPLFQMLGALEYGSQMPLT